MFAALVVSGQTVACGLGVLENEYFGLFDVVIAPAERRKGYGTQLILGLACMCVWAFKKPINTGIVSVYANCLREYSYMIMYQSYLLMKAFSVALSMPLTGRPLVYCTSAES